VLRILRAGSLAAVTLAVAACGTGGRADEGATGGGEALFQQKCGGCHALAAAGTRGIEGPDLDAAFAAPRAEGFDESSIREVVLGQMRYPIAPMPPPDELFPLTDDYTTSDREQDLHAIAAYVASVAANEEAIAQAREEARAASDPRSLFTSNCAGCHTFAPAGSTATIGPSLDTTTLELSAIEQQIRRGGGGMPAFEGQLTDEQIAALAEYVARGR
jgi:mono/diheme cytochrome c family protein